MEQKRSHEAKCPSFQLRPVGIDVKPSIQILSLWLYILKSEGCQKSYINEKILKDGQEEVIQEKNGEEVRLAGLSKRNFFGEMAIFDCEVRSATVHASGIVQALTIDKRTFLRKITKDPALAFRIIEKMSLRIRDLNAEIVHHKTGD